MDMKKILQALDGVPNKPKVDSTDMKRFVSIVAEGAGPLNRLTPAENIVVNHYSTPTAPSKSITSPVLNIATDAKPSMVGKYFKMVEEEFDESEQRYKTRASQLAERVAAKMTGRKPVNESDQTPIDSITLNIPLLLRLLEYAKEDAKTDMDLHWVAENLIKLSNHGVLGMDSYDAIISDHGNPSSNFEPPSTMVHPKHHPMGEELGDFQKGLSGKVKSRAAEKQAAQTIQQAKNPGQWKWNNGDVILSRKTGKTYRIVGRYYDDRKNRPMYFYERGDKTGGGEWEQGSFDANKAHEAFTQITVSECNECMEACWKGMKRKTETIATEGTGSNCMFKF